MARHGLALACLSALCAGGWFRGASAAPQDSLLATGGAVGDAQAVGALVLRTDLESWNDLCLRRAVQAWSTGRLDLAIEQLESIPLEATAGWLDADKATLLLSQAHLRRGDSAGFLRVANARLNELAARNENGTALDRWLRYELLRQRTTPATATGDTATKPAGVAPMSGGLLEGLPAADLLVAALLMQQGEADAAARLLREHHDEATPKALRLALLAAALQPAAADSNFDGASSAPGASRSSSAWREALEELAHTDAESPIEHDLVAAARLRLAAIGLRQGKDPRELLEGVASESRLVGEARLMLALHLLELANDGGRDAAVALLARVASEDQDPRRRREAQAALGGIALERDDWAGAYRGYSQADSSWRAQWARLATLQSTDPTEQLWQQWDAQASPPDGLLMDPAALKASATELVAACLDLRNASLDRLPTPDRALPWSATASLVPDVAPPPAPQWQRAHAARKLEAQASAELLKAERAAQREQQLLERQRGYMTLGRARVDDTSTRLLEASARLDSLLARIDGVVDQLTGARDEHLRQAALRTRDLLERQQLQLSHLLFLRHFYVDGPNRERAEIFPEQVPSPEQLLAADELLSLQVAAFVDSFAARVPELVERSFREIWEPRLTGGTRDLARRAEAELARARRLGALVDSTLAASHDSPGLRAALAAVDAAHAAAQQATEDRQRLEAEIARASLARAIAQLQREREGIEYGLAAASHELAVGRGEDSEDVLVRERLRGARAVAIAHLDSFLARYPQSFARGEVRFRLADMRLMAAKDDFNTKMATFLAAARADGGMDQRAMAPFVDYEPALQLYEAIRAEDPDYPHQDAVLFNIGMIQSDAGLFDEAQVTLAELVGSHPQSPFCQEAHLRMGDNLFYAKDYVGCTPSFEQAAAGPDPEFSAIALYKLGWARFNEDQFVDAADAFRRLFDLYASGVQVKSTADLRVEAEDYLIHSLCRAGGADAFVAYFERIGARPYEAQILAGMGTLMRRFSLYDDAAAVDQAWLARYGDQPAALATAQRLIDTLERWNKLDRARAARLEVASRFLPGSSWFSANDSDSLRAEGKRFALGSYRTVALFHHHEARAGKGDQHWQQALELYRTLLSLWPMEPEAPRFQFYAGEAAAQMRDWPAALAHYTAAAATASDTASFRADARWQRVAVVDAWYQTTLPAPGAAPAKNVRAITSAAASVGSDSLAHRLVEVAVEFAAAQPSDPRRADVLWRAGTLAYAHHWNDEAAPLLLRFAQEHAGDPRAPVAARLRADAFYRTQRYDAAADAYEVALSAARTAHNDTLVARIAPIVPLCRLQHAEAVAMSDSTHPGRAAVLFAQLAARHPEFEHADRALYRAGLGYRKAGDIKPAVQAWENLIATHPGSEYVQDAQLQVASAWEQDDHPREAATAYERFAAAYPKDEAAADAMLKAADLWSEAGDEVAAETVRTRYMDRYPSDFETAMQILQRRARHELDQLQSPASLATLLPPKSKGAPSAPSSLARYLDLASKHPELAAVDLLARVDFLKAEQRFASYAAARLTQPLAASVEAKKQMLEKLLGDYRACAARGIRPWTQASAHRIGEALVHFGDALKGADAPAGLAGDDLLAYREVLEQQAWEFYDRGEEAWSQLLVQAAREVRVQADQDGGDTATQASAREADQWIDRTRQKLWPRVAQRFVHRPEAEFPVVATPTGSHTTGSH